MILLKNGEPEEFLIFIRDYQKALEATGAMSAIGRIRYLCTLLRGEALRNFNNISYSIVPTPKIKI